jgi:hypothetical protein
LGFERLIKFRNPDTHHIGIFIHGRRYAVSNLYVDLAIFGDAGDARASCRKSRDVSSRGKFAARDTIGGRWRWMMLDVLFLALGLGFFAAGCLYLYACDRL